MKEQKSTLATDASVEELKECLWIYKNLTPKLRERGIGGLYMLKAAQDVAAERLV